MVGDVRYVDSQRISMFTTSNGGAHLVTIQRPTSSRYVENAIKFCTARELVVFRECGSDPRHLCLEMIGDRARKPSRKAGVSNRRASSGTGSAQSRSANHKRSRSSKPQA